MGRAGAPRWQRVSHPLEQRVRSPRAIAYSPTCLGTAVSDKLRPSRERLSCGKAVTAGISVSYTDAHYTQTVTQGGVPIVRDGDVVGTPPLVTSPWNVVASLEQRFSLRAGQATFRAEDVFRSRNPGPFYTSGPANSPYYAPDLTSDPSINMLNLRTTFDRENFSVTLFVNNVLDSQPTLLKRNKGLDTSTLFSMPPRSDREPSVSQGRGVSSRRQDQTSLESTAQRAGAPRDCCLA